MAVDLTKLTNDLNTDPLIQKDIQKAILEETPHESTILPYMTKLRNMTSSELEMKTLSMIPYGEWIDSGQLKPVGGIGWDNRSIMARELAVIIPIKDDVINDAASNGYDIWAEIRKWTKHSAAVMIDQALLWGTNIPTAWNMDSIYSVAQATNAIVSGSGDLYQDLLGEDGIQSMVEQSAYMPNRYLSWLGGKGTLRGLVDATGQPLFRQGMNSSTEYMLDSVPIGFQAPPIWDRTKGSFIVGDFSQFVYSMRQDIRFTPFTEGVISDSDGRVVINLMQQDMSALRMTLRMAWGCPIKFHDGITNGERKPFAILA
jgi:HK97 family phage major capsid protein